jgi:GAF domain-containing protein
MDRAAPGTDEAFAAFMQRLAQSGLRAALVYLFGLTDYRFIAIFRFSEGKASTVVFYDRENPQALESEEVPASATYCSFARDARGVFMTADAMQDRRLDGHAAREAIRAYFGTPVMTPEGEILGTLCIYDQVPRDPAHVDLELMLRVASSLAQQISADVASAYVQDWAARPDRGPDAG